MKQIKDIFLMILLLSVGLTSCSTDDFKATTPAGAAASLQISVSDFKGKTGTRTNESGYQTSFTEDDQIGVFAILTSNNTVLNDNIPYRYVSASSSWQPVNTGADNEVYVYDSGVSYYAYYPYSSTMDGKKSLAEIIAAFTPVKDQSTYIGYTSADLMTGTGTLSGNTLTIGLNHAMTLVEVSITETTNHTPYVGEPTFYGTIPWKTPTGMYRYLVVPGIEAAVAFEYGPTYNRYSFHEKIVAANVVAGQYISVTAPFDNTSVILNTGRYTGNMGALSKVIINGDEYTVTAISGSDNEYTLNGLRNTPETLTSFDVYIADNLAKEDSKEQLLVSATTANITVDAATLTMTLPLSAGGMEGDGTSETDPYRVTTPSQLRGVGVEGADNEAAETKYYKQTADLDLMMYADWKPVKSGKLYEGGGYKVSNLNSTQGGIFSNNGGTIQNVHLVSGVINNNSNHAGGIANCSRLSGSKVANCSNAASITAGSSGEKGAGGIVGSIYWGGNAIITDCKNTGSITGNLAGGILGDAVNGGNQVLYCYNEGTITGIGNDNLSGGIAGRSWCQMHFCYNIGAVTGSKPGAIQGEARKEEVRTKNCWASSTPFIGSGNIECTLFDNAGNQWPAYDTDSSNGWGSAHWKSYSQGEYPKLLWEEP